MSNIWLKRHLGKNLIAFLKYQTPRKLLNFFQVEYEVLTKQKNLRSFPYVLTVDITNACNLHCPFCPTGNRTPGRKKGIMSVELFKEIIDVFKDYAYVVNLYNWGESLLHPQIYEMIQYAHERGIFTSVSSNFSIPFSSTVAENMIKSGLDYLIVSVDGATQEKYSTYRVGGDLEQIFSNVRCLVAEKKKLGADHPFIESRFLVFRHNEEEIELAEKLFSELEVNRIAFDPGLTEDMSDRRAEDKEEWLPIKEKYRRTWRYEESFCKWLWRNFTVNWDGSVASCCWAFKPEHDFGVFNKNQFHQIWNNDKFQASRAIFKDRSVRKAQTFCDECIKVKKWQGRLS